MTQLGRGPNEPNLFLIGYRATGKTTVARLVARALGWQAVDADEVLEARAGRTIREIFARDGEPAFRRLESAVLEELCRERHQVIATGGGVVLTEGNRARLREAGLVVWLKADPATVWQRMSGDATTWGRRPDLTVGGLEEIEALLRVREPHYRACAAGEVDTAGRSPEEVAAAVLGHWQRFAGAIQK